MNIDSIIIKHTAVGAKIIKFLLEKYNNLNVAYLQKLIRTGEIKVNNKKTTFHYLLNLNDVVTLNTQPFTNFTYVKPSKKPINLAHYQHIINDLQKSIIYNGDNFIAINKPSGIAVQGGSGVNFSIADTLESLVSDVKLKLVHRLDKETSGVLLLAKSAAAANYAFNLFKSQLISKTYHAIIIYNITKLNEHGCIDRNLLKTAITATNKELVTVDENGKNAITFYKVLREHKPFALMEFSPKTGRTHQLRVHTNDEFRGYIVGDYKYGFSKNKLQKQLLGQLDLKKMYLHAHTLSFNDLNGEPVLINCPHPEYFKFAIDTIF